MSGVARSSRLCLTEAEYTHASASTRAPLLLPMRAVITGFSQDQTSASAASQREAAIAREVLTGCLLWMTKESGAGIPGTSWAVSAASPGPPAHRAL